MPLAIDGVMAIMRLKTVLPQDPRIDAHTGRSLGSVHHFISAYFKAKLISFRRLIHVCIFKHVVACRIEDTAAGCLTVLYIGSVTEVDWFSLECFKS